MAGIDVNRGHWTCRHGNRRRCTVSVLLPGKTVFCTPPRLGRDARTSSEHRAKKKFLHCSLRRLKHTPDRSTDEVQSPRERPFRPRVGLTLLVSTAPPRSTRSSSPTLADLVDQRLFETSPAHLRRRGTIDSGTRSPAPTYSATRNQTAIDSGRLASHHGSEELFSRKKSMRASSRSTPPPTGGASRTHQRPTPVHYVLGDHRLPGLGDPGRAGH